MVIPKRSVVAVRMYNRLGSPKHYDYLADCPGVRKPGARVCGEAGVDAKEAMPVEKPRELVDKEIEQSPVLQDLLEQARSRGHSLVSYHGMVFAITPVEDITHTFSPEELKEFLLDFAEADKPDNHLTVEQALARYKQRVRLHGGPSADRISRPETPLPH